ncbi:MAG: Fe-S protein assembly co-chaperone HscB [Magnetococcales bacterium]|nr:Fe-S protein assembly co-chaperone HscB [Magnetococcales bacterium]
MANPSRSNFFAQFDLPVAFAIDVGVLEQRYRAQQQHWHPDRFATASATEQEHSLQQTTLVNEAWQTLRDPLSRATYLLQWIGYQPTPEESGDHDTDFLMQVMAEREALEEIDVTAGSALSQLEALRQQMEQEIAHAFSEIAALFAGIQEFNPADRQRWQRVSQLIDQQRYRQRFLEQVDQIEEQQLYGR